jgi:phage-related protein (TIGR01555 family)
MESLKKALVSYAERTDSWVNAITGLGSVSKDKTMSMYFGREGRIADETLAAMHAENDIAAKIVEAVPETAFRNGVDLQPPENIDQEDAAAWTGIITDELERLGAHDALFRAAVWGRLFGRGAVIIGADDGRLPNEPLGENVRSISSLVVVDKRDLIPEKIDSDLTSSGFGQVETYRLQSAVDVGNVATGVGMEIHASRVIVFGGALTTRRDWQQNNRCDHSVLLRVRDAMRLHASDWQSVSNMLTDSSQGVLKVNDFYEITAGGMKEAFSERLNIMAMARFSGRLIPIDTNEEFQYVERSFSGIPDLLDRSMQRLSAATGIPVTVLFGRSPAGMNATGESDLANWYSVVGSHQTQKYGPQYSRLVQIVAMAVGAPEPGSWTVTWPSLWQQSPEQEAATKKVIGETDKIYIDSGVLDPDEVGLARFGSGKWSPVAPAIDAALRAAPRNEADETRGDGRLDSWDEEFMPPAILNDLKAIEKLSRSNAPTKMTREIMLRLAKSLGFGSAEILEEIRWHEFGAEPDTGRVRMDAYQGQQMPPLAAIDVICFEALSRIGAPRGLLRAIARRIAANMSIASEDVLAAIEQHDYSWMGDSVPGVTVDVRVSNA